MPITHHPSPHVQVVNQCGLTDVVPNLWVEPVSGVIPGNGFRIDWLGLWADIADGVSVQNIQVGRASLWYKVVEVWLCTFAVGRCFVVVESATRPLGRAHLLRLGRQAAVSVTPPCPLHHGKAPTDPFKPPTTCVLQEFGKPQTDPHYMLDLFERRINHTELRQIALFDVLTRLVVACQAVSSAW